MNKETKKALDIIFFSPSEKKVNNGYIIQDNRSEQERISHQEKIIKALPLVQEYLEGLIENVIETFESYDNISILNYLAFLHLKNNMNDDGKSERILEYAMSIATSIPKIKKPSASIHIIKILSDKIHNILMIYSKTLSFAELNQNGNKLSNKYNDFAFSRQIETLFIRGEAYSKILYDVFKDFFKQHDSFFLKHYGFTSKDILQTILELEDALYIHIKSRKGEQLCADRFKEWQKSKGLKLFKPHDKTRWLEFLSDNPDIQHKNGEITFFTKDKFNFQIHFRNNKQKKVADSLSCEFGSNNYIDHKFSGSPLQLNTIINYKPIIKNNKKYYFFSYSLSTRNLFLIAENLIKNKNNEYYDNHYLGNKYSYTRDNYLECKTKEIFDKILPSSKIYPNNKYPIDSKTYENDILIETSKANYIIEAKAGSLPDAALRGALSTLKSKLKGIVGDGYIQANRTYKYIKEGAGEFLQDTTDKVTKVDKTKKTFRIVITLSMFTSMFTSFKEAKSLELIQSDLEPVWLCSLFDLIVFKDIIDNENDFIDYLEQRMKLYLEDKLYISDELDVLGLFLKNNNIYQNLNLKEGEELIILNHHEEIDNYFEKGGARPKKKRIVT